MTRLLKNLLLVIPLASPRLSAQTLTITNATVVDVSNGALHRGSTVVIDGNRIVSVGPPSANTQRRGQVVDAKGMFVIPGLWDMHTHAYFGWPADFGDTYVLPLFIANGVTGIRDMGSDLDAVLRARSEVAAHRLVGPRMVVSGPMLDGPQVAFAASIAIKTPDDGRKAVAMLKARGVDFIKIQSGVPRDAYFAIAAEAKTPGPRVRRARARCHPRVRSRHGRSADVRASHRDLRGEHAGRRSIHQAQVRRGKGLGGEQEPRRVPRPVRPRARSEHHPTPRQQERLAVPDAVLGAWSVARGRHRLHEGSGPRVHATHVDRPRNIRRCGRRSTRAWARTR